MSDGGINSTDWIFKKAKELEAENARLKGEVMGLEELGEYKSHKIDKLVSIARSEEQKLEAANLQIEAMRSALQKIVDNTHVDTCLNPGFEPCDCLENIAKGGLSLKMACEHVYVDYQCEKCGKGDPQKGVFCLEHRKVMTNGICPKCGQQ